MKFSDSLIRSLRSLAHAKVRTLLTALALAVGGFTLSLTLAAANGARAFTDQLVRDNFDPSSLVVVKDKDLLDTSGKISTGPKAYDESLTNVGNGGLFKTLTQADLDKIKALPDVKGIFADYQTPLQYVTKPADPAVKVTGTAIAHNPNLNSTFAAGNADNLGGDGVLLPESYLQMMKFSSPQAAIGQQITLQINPASRFSYVIRGVVTPPKAQIGPGVDNLMVSEAAARELYLAKNNGTLHLTNIYATASGGSDEASLQKTKSEIERAGYGAVTVKETQQVIGQIINVLQIVILVFGAITLIASFFGVVNTQYISVLERTREIGLMKALGMSRRGVSRLFVLEATWIGFLGALIGSALAVLVGTLLNPTISEKIGFGSKNLLVFDYKQIVILILFLMLVTTIAGLLPARKAAKLDPIVALRTE